MARTASRWAESVFVAGLGGADPVVADPVDSPGAVAVQDFLAGAGGDDAAFVGEEFQAVVLDRVVAGGDLDGAGRLVFSHQHADGGRGADAGVDRPPADGLQTGMNRLGEHPARGPAVASDDHGSRGRRGGESGGVADGHLGRKGIAQHAP